MDEATTQICDFLWYGYIPSTRRAAERFGYYRALLADDTVPVLDGRDTVAAKRLLCAIVEESTYAKGVAEVFVPLSVGFDSRGILGALLEIYPVRAIHAVTFGHAGTEDYELARGFTRDLLPDHRPISGLVQKWDTATRTDWISRRPADHVTGIGEFEGVDTAEFRDLLDLPQLNGFLGDALSGKKLPKLPSGRWQDATAAYARRFQTFKGSIPLLPPDYNPLVPLPDEPFPGGRSMMLDDQIQFLFRQEQQIRWGTRPAKITPFYDPRWLRSFLLLPVTLRLGQQPFYRHMLARSFPALFPDLAEWRPSRTLLHPPAPPEVSNTGKSKQHIDFGVVFDADPAFRAFCRENIEDLKARGILDWLDLSALLRRAADGHALELGRSLYGLASLEINLKAGKLPMSR